MIVIFLWWLGVCFAVLGAAALVVDAGKRLADALATLDVENRRTRR